MWDSHSVSLALSLCVSLSVCLLLSLRDKLLQNYKRVKKKITNREEKRDFSQVGFPLPNNPSMLLLTKMLAFVSPACCVSLISSVFLCMFSSVSLVV